MMKILMFLWVFGLVFHGYSLAEEGCLKNTKHPTMVVSGAGPAGIMGALELRQLGYPVILIEKRGDFSRSNLLNLRAEVEGSLGDLGILEAFQKRFPKHEKVLHFSNNQLLDEKTQRPREVETTQWPSYEANESLDFLKQGAFYSVATNELQTFLLEKALAAGVVVVQNATFSLQKRGSHFDVMLKQSSCPPVMISADKVFIAEGANSDKLLGLGIEYREFGSEKRSSGEEWLYGQFKYSGDETFLTADFDYNAEGQLVTATEGTFDARKKVVNLGVLLNYFSKSHLSHKEILQQQAERIFENNHLLSHLGPRIAMSPVVKVRNRILNKFHEQNVFITGDAAGHTSPFLGLGATLSMTAYPYAIRKLIQENDANEYDKRVRSYVENRMNLAEKLKNEYLLSLAQWECSGSASPAYWKNSRPEMLEYLSRAGVTELSKGRILIRYTDSQGKYETRLFKKENSNAEIFGSYVGENKRMTVSFETDTFGQEQGRTESIKMRISVPGLAKIFYCNSINHK